MPLRHKQDKKRMKQLILLRVATIGFPLVERLYHQSPDSFLVSVGKI